METFKTLLFGISGLSMIFWVAVIGLWHVDMFPKMFKGDLSAQGKQGIGSIPAQSTDQAGFLGQGALRPASSQSIGLFNRNKYSRKSIVVADFSPIDPDYAINRLYTSVILSVGVMSFIFLTLGLHSAMTSVA